MKTKTTFLATTMAILALSFSSLAFGDVTLVAEDFDGGVVGFGLNPSNGLTVTSVADPLDATNMVGRIEITGGGQWQSLIGNADAAAGIDYNYPIPAGTTVGPGGDTLTFKYRMYVPSVANGGAAQEGTGAFNDTDKSSSLIRVNGTAPDAYPPSVQYWVGNQITFDEWIQFEFTEEIPEFNNLPMQGGLDPTDPTTSIQPIWSIHIPANATPGTQSGLFGYVDDFEISVTGTPVVGGLTCDFNADTQCDIADLDQLYANFGGPLSFDLDSSGTVDAGDIGAWLMSASDPANTYLGGTKTFVIGDVDLDGDVDSTDLGLLLNNFGDMSGVDFGGGNLNDDQNVDSTDLGLLLNNFGATSAAAAAVPEPGALSLLLIAALGMVGFGRRR